MLQGVGGIGLHSSKRAGSCIWKYFKMCLFRYSACTATRLYNSISDCNFGVVKSNLL